MKTIKQVVIYYTDGTYQAIDSAAVAPVLIPKIRDVEPDDFWKHPGRIGTWPTPPFDTGTTIVD
jgi:hypothetical protein